MEADAPHTTPPHQARDQQRASILVPALRFFPVRWGDSNFPTIPPLRAFARVGKLRRGAPSTDISIFPSRPGIPQGRPLHPVSPGAPGPPTSGEQDAPPTPPPTPAPRPRPRPAPAASQPARRPGAGDSNGPARAAAQSGHQGPQPRPGRLPHSPLSASLRGSGPGRAPSRGASRATDGAARSAARWLSRSLARGCRARHRADQAGPAPWRPRPERPHPRRGHAPVLLCERRATCTNPGEAHQRTPTRRNTQHQPKYDRGMHAWARTHTHSSLPLPAEAVRTALSTHLRPPAAGAQQGGTRLGPPHAHHCRDSGCWGPCSQAQENPRGWRWHQKTSRAWFHLGHRAGGRWVSGGIGYVS